jgi:diketogulonate reductase-like aldo/keto reductase
MKHRRFGPAGPEVPLIGMGTWQIDGDNRDAVIGALRRGIDLGMTHIDTAEMYGGAEDIVGEAIAGHRDGIFLVSKVLPSNASRQGTIRACERSLARLKTDRLDCYLLHWPGATPIEDTVAGFEQLVRDGKILSWGVSNFDVLQLDAALRVCGPGHIVCNQVLYHLRERAIEHAVIPWCEAHGVAVVAYSPFGHGDFLETGEQPGRRAPRHRRRSPRDATADRPGLPGAPGATLHDPQGLQRGPRGGERGGGANRPVTGRDRPPGRGISLGPEAARLADALTGLYWPGLVATAAETSPRYASVSSVLPYLLRRSIWLLSRTEAFTCGYPLSAWPTMQDARPCRPRP